MLLPRLLAVLSLVAVATSCEDKPAPASAPSATSAPEPPPAPAKPTLPPTIGIDTGGVLIAGNRVTLEGSGVLERLKSELETHKSFIENQEVRFSAERKVKPAYVARVLEGLGAAGASRALVRTSTRADFPSEVGFLPPAKAKSAPRCSVVSMIQADRSTATWQLSGGVAGKRGKGMAGPDLTLTGETIAERAKRCKESPIFFVSGAEGVEWGLVYDLAASAKTLGGAYFSDVALIAGGDEVPVPGRPVELAP